MLEKSQGGLQMRGPRKRFSGEFKTKVALEAIKGLNTVTEIASQYGVHPNQVTHWKKQVMEALPEVLEDKRRKKKEDHEALVCELYQQIGQLKVELDWLKKKSGLGT
jgi:putative transposase